MATTDSGERKAWGLLAAADPAEVVARAGVGLDPAGGFQVPSFGRQYRVDPGQRLILNLAPEGEPLLSLHGDLFRLSVLWYLVSAARVCPTGGLVNPARLPGGDIFARGTHVLPLDALAAKFATHPEAFLTAGAALGARPAAYGDAAVELPALPKVPVTLILRTADDEFPARADLLLDATAPQHLPTDILWSVAMLSVQQFL